MKKFLVLISLAMSHNVFGAENGPVTCTVTKIMDETAETMTHSVPLQRGSGDTFRYNLTLDGFVFRTAVPAREISGIYLVVKIDDDSSVSAEGVRGLTKLSFTGKTGAGIAHFDFFCK